LRNSNYANINWNGLCAVIASLTFICLASFAIEHWDDVQQTSLSILELLGRWLFDGLACLGRCLRSAPSRGKVIKASARRKFVTLKARWRPQPASSSSAGHMDATPLGAASVQSSTVVSIDLEDLLPASGADDPPPNHEANTVS
jgi:hypothetical protein